MNNNFTKHIYLLEYFRPHRTIKNCKKCKSLETLTSGTRRPVERGGVTRRRTAAIRKVDDILQKRNSETWAGWLLLTSLKRETVKSEKGIGRLSTSLKSKKMKKEKDEKCKVKIKQEGCRHHPWKEKSNFDDKWTSSVRCFSNCFKSPAVIDIWGSICV